MNRFFFLLLFCGLIDANVSISAQAVSGIEVTVQKSTGEYTISAPTLHWKFTGSTGHSLTGVKTSRGHDENGDFKEISFRWQADIPYTGVIKWYPGHPVVFFSEILPKGSPTVPSPFPSFTAFPSNMHVFSYGNDVFAPPQFKLNETSTPWLFFNDKKEAFILSPASDFMVSKLTGDGHSLISSGLNSGIKNLPAHFDHSTILTMGEGIRRTWDQWGDALRKRYKRVRPANDAGTVLKYFGYWTDNGADYYYNYDTTLGYAGTLLALRKRYQKEDIPIKYMQLDSWWYEKSIYDPNGKPDAGHKNRKLSAKGEWNRYGGLLSYTADPLLFPGGLAGFDHKLGLPLVTHNRWIDPRSPYHDHYKISGYAAVDPKFWTHIIQNIGQAGVICYEQDWLNYIYSKSPDMQTNLKAGNAFTDGMANACKASGLTMQYCMAMPRYFLQGLKYNNLTTIRTSDDRFNPEKWNHFLFTSQLAYEMGIWPWCDVFKSHETGNMILSVLSGGPVGTGDAMGKEDKANIMLACRNDGVLVKPDVPIMPLDADYLQEAKKEDLPTLAYTYTKDGPLTTDYLFAFTRSKSGDKDFDFSPAALGLKGQVVVFDPLSGKVQQLQAAGDFKARLPNQLYTYYIIAPVTSTGIAFLGDQGKIAAVGKKRIAMMSADDDALKVKVIFAPDESSVTLRGFSQKAVTANKGKVSYDPVTHLFTLHLASSGKQAVTVNMRQKG